MQDCEITVVGEKNKVIMYTVAFAAIDQYRDSECATLLEVFDGRRVFFFINKSKIKMMQKETSA